MNTNAMERKRLFFFLVFSRAALVAYGGSQAKSLSRAVATGLSQSHSNAGSEPYVLWFLKNYPYRLESLDPYIPEELHCKSTKLGYLQLLPGIHKTDGFFIARFRRK